MVAHPAGTTDGPVLVGVDGSPESTAAVRFAAAEAGWRGAELVAVHADHDEIDADTPMGTRWRRVAGDPAQVLVTESATAQLVVVGARGSRGDPGFLLGSVAQTLLHRANCPVAVVHGEPVARGTTSEARAGVVAVLPPAGPAPYGA